ncbi:MAG: class I SAM-dependent methyltransferase [Planctomycetia bacterium]|nr:class I SAM-dependent methyltransferase [Planctomycetia bacterium]
MNWIHRQICRSGWWRRYVERDLLPWVLQAVELGDKLLEVGPGPGLTTTILADRSNKLTALEIDPKLAQFLRSNANLSGVEVVEGDATAMPFAESSFASVLSFTMMHHIPSASLQDKMLTEAYRVLRPNGTFIGTDSIWSPIFGLAHFGDTMILINPDTFESRLSNAGFTEIEIEKRRKAFRFRARKPAIVVNPV